LLAVNVTRHGANPANFQNKEVCVTPPWRTRDWVSHGIGLPKKYFYEDGQAITLGNEKYYSVCENRVPWLLASLFTIRLQQLLPVTESNNTT
jgi:hypothetical protein